MLGAYMNLKVGTFVSSQLAESRVLRTGHAYEPKNPLAAKKCELVHTFSGASYHRF
jgi:hypothetical protein